MKKVHSSSATSSMDQLGAAVDNPGQVGAGLPEGPIRSNSVTCTERSTSSKRGEKGEKGKEREKDGG